PDANPRLRQSASFNTPTSHCSVAGFRKESPQTLKRQVPRQASSSFKFPSSHSSPLSTTPFPQFSNAPPLSPPPHEAQSVTTAKTNRKLETANDRCMRCSSVLRDRR